MKKQISYHLGLRLWLEIKVWVNQHVDFFLSTAPYSYESSLGDVAATSGLLTTTPESLHQHFGKWWILHTSRDGYGHLVVAGRALADVLKNIRNFRARIGMVCLDFKPTECEWISTMFNRKRVCYQSSRNALAPFAASPLHCPGDKFANALGIIHEHPVVDGGDHGDFHFDWYAQAPLA